MVTLKKHNGCLLAAVDTFFWIYHGSKGLFRSLAITEHSLNGCIF